MSETEKAMYILGVVREFILDNEVRCEETVYQTDRVMGNAAEFIAEICGIAGFMTGEVDV